MQDSDILQNKIENLESKIENLESKIDNIIEILTYDIKPNCNKMDDHIDFVETIYENVKNPLGFICNKINTLTGSTIYRLEDSN